MTMLISQFHKFNVVGELSTSNPIAQSLKLVILPLYHTTAKIK